MGILLGVEGKLLSSSSLPRFMPFELEDAEPPSPTDGDEFAVPVEPGVESKFGVEWLLPSVLCFFILFWLGL